MKILHKEAPEPPPGKVIIEMTEDEAAHLADFFAAVHDEGIRSSWPVVRKLIKEIIDLAGQW